jgi:hypothetical protein
MLDELRARAAEVEAAQAELEAARARLAGVAKAAHLQGVSIARISREAGVSRQWVHKLLKVEGSEG